jgi:hypothetical protein
MKSKNTKIPKSNIKIAERGKIDTPNTKIHDRSFSWLGTVTSIKKGVKLVLYILIRKHNYSISIFFKRRSFLFIGGFQ